MAKRRRDGTLTGGTGDINPQWFTSNTIDPAVAYAEVTMNMPIQRLPSTGKAQVMEILKVQVCFSTTTQIAVTAGTDSSSRFYFLSTSNGTTEPTSGVAGRLIWKGTLFLPSIAASTASGYIMEGEPIMDLTDGAGHGVLLATDTAFFGVAQTAAASPIAAGSIFFRFLYRFKNISLQEYIGIVQSQQ